jgi:ATP-dependent Clp protease adaptor protein ClpS
MSERLPDSLPQRAPSPGVPSAATGVQDRPAPERVDELPPFRVLLHNDPVNDFVHVIETICDLTPLSPQRAAAVTMEAHNSGVALVLMTHKERAELYLDQFQSKSLKVTIEPAT